MKIFDYINLYRTISEIELTISPGLTIEKFKILMILKTGYQKKKLSRMILVTHLDYAKLKTDKISKAYVPLCPARRRNCKGANQPCQC